MNVGCILAGGRGSRFGGTLPKQFVEVLGRPVLAWTLEAFQRSPAIDAIQVICQPEYEERVKAIAREGGIHKLRWIAPAGATCPESIRNGFYGLRDTLADDDNVVLHMGVSPLVTPDDIENAVRVCRERGCCFTMHPVNICLARGGGEGWADTDAPKERFVELNTPWVFRYGAVYGLYRDLERHGQPVGENDYTLGLWLSEGRRAWYVRGSDRGRLKITTAHDLEIFEGLLRLEQLKRTSKHIKTR